MRRADTGDERWLSLYGRFIYDSTGNAVRLLGVSQDVTERKVAEETVRSHSELLAAVFEFMPAAINIIRGSDLRLVLANPGYRAIAPGKGDPVGKTLDELWPETGRDFSTLCRHVLETGEPYHAVDQLVHIQRSFDGPIENAYFTWSLFRIRLPGNEGWGIFNAAWETTHRVKAEEALRESEARFRHMADNAPVMIWVTEADGCCTFLSKSWLEFTGQTSEAALGFGWLAAVHPADTDQAHKLFMEATARHESFAMEYRLRHQDGHYSWVYDSARPRFSETGEFLGFIGSVIDITSRKHSEDAIKATRDSFRQLVEQSPFGVYAVDADFRLAMVSAGAQKVFENVRPLLGRDFSEVLRTIWPEPFVSNVLDKFRRVLATGESYHAPRTVEQRADIRETESYDWKLERFVLPDGRPGVVCHFYDLSERQRYEETLRIANNRLETALHASQVALSHQDKDLRYTWAHNPGLGYSSQDLLGKRAREVLQRGEDAVNVDAIKRKVLETGTATRTEIKLWQDGQFRYYDLVVQPDRNPNGEIIGVNSAAIDITDRKRIEAALRESEQKQVFLLRLSDALRSLSDPAAIQKQATRVLGEHLRVDRACYVEISEETGIFKIEHEYNRGDSRSLVGQLSIKDFQWVIPLMRTGDLVVVSDVRQSPVIPVDDRAMMETIQIAAHVNAPLIKSDQLVGALCVTEPVPRQWTNIELELIKETAERIWSAVERARAEAALKESDQRKDEFLATLSHELRNPLATLQTGLEVLSRNPEQPTLVQTTGLMMRRQLTHLVALVDDLLEVSRISRGKLKLRQETVELSDAIYAAIEMSRPIIEETRHSLQVDIPSETILIHGDPHRLTQLFCNLLNNAAKYTPNGGKIEIKVELDGKDVVTAIKDSGIGLAAEQLTRVFDLFTQVEKDSPNYAGLGIGLSLVKSLVQLHGGRTWAESAGRNQGSTFFVRLPRSTAVLISEPTSMVDHTSSAHPTKVLVVDDNIDAGNTLALLIKLMGHQVSTATNGQEAVDKGRVMQPDLILMDIGMPIMDGYAAARAIRQETWGQSVALIALTGWGQDEDRQKSKAAGFDQHLVKPVDATAIQRVISEHKPRSQNV